MIEFDSASAFVGSTVTERHFLVIEGYSHTNLPPVDEGIESHPFSVGGRMWRIWFYPSGMHVMGVARTSYIFIVVGLDDSIPEPVYAEARYFLLDRVGNEMLAHTQSTGMCSYKQAGSGGGHGFSIKREFIEAPECLADGCFKIRIDIRVFTGSHSENRGTMASAAVPPPDLHRHMGDLLVAGEGADVTFQVAGETFRAHKCVLAARSPVFKAELFGAMRGSNDAAEVCIRVHDMEPHVFSSLLHFVYTDSLPPEMMTGQNKEDEVAMAQHLLEAADRYDMQRLKLTCEEMLCRCLNTDTAATTLVLADQHHCHRLKKACIEFLRSPYVLNAVVPTDGFELIRSYPDLSKELVFGFPKLPPLDLVRQQ